MQNPTETLAEIEEITDPHYDFFIAQLQGCLAGGGSRYEMYIGGAVEDGKHVIDFYSTIKGILPTITSKIFRKKFPEMLQLCQTQGLTRYMFLLTAAFLKRKKLGPQALLEVLKAQPDEFFRESSKTRSASKNKSNKNRVQSLGGTLLCAFIKFGQHELAKYLINERQVSVNSVVHQGATPLLLLMKSDAEYDSPEGRMELLALLCRKSANVNHYNERNETPLSVAINYLKFPDEMQYLLKYGANPLLPISYHPIAVHEGEKRERNTPQDKPELREDRYILELAYNMLENPTLEALSEGQNVIPYLCMFGAGLVRLSFECNFTRFTELLDRSLKVDTVKASEIIFRTCVEGSQRYIFSLKEFSEFLDSRVSQNDKQRQILDRICDFVLKASSEETPENHQPRVKPIIVKLFKKYRKKRTEIELTSRFFRDVSIIVRSYLGLAPEKIKEEASLPTKEETSEIIQESDELEKETTVKHRKFY